MKNYFLLTLLLFSAISQAQIVNIPDANFKNALVNTNCVDTDFDFILDDDADTNNDGEIQVSEAEAILWLDVTSQSISSLEGIQSFIYLERLFCGSNDLTVLDLTQNPNLQWIDCFNNDIVSLDITQNQNLTILEVNNNNLTELDLTQNINLERINTSFNQINNLDLSQNLKLRLLMCRNNQMTSLNVTNNINLEELNCIGNNLTSLITQNPFLKDLDCSNNQLTSLDVSQNPNLEDLYCSFNQITSLDVSQNLNLIILSCWNNQLISLNSKNGNNHNMLALFTIENPNLSCIQVDDIDYANSQVCASTNWCKDDWASYSENCELGIEDVNQLSFVLYPNPTQDFLHIESQESFELIKIYAVNGVLIKETSNTSINLSDLPSGLYFAQIISEEKKMTKKFIKS